VSRILKKTGKVSEEALKSQVNVVESSQGAEARGWGNFDNGGKGYFKDRGQGNYRSRGCINFNQGRDNNFRAFNEGRGAGNFGVANRGWGQGNNYQGRANFNCFIYGKFRHRVADCRLK